MFVFKNFIAHHSDCIHDLQFDIHCRRFVTCGNDSFIKVWDLNDDNEWYCSASLEGNIGSVWKVAWSFPDFGQVIASCGIDQTVSIWEEVNEKQAGPSAKKQTSWLKRAQLINAYSKITDLKFAPQEFGLQLALSSADGMIQIYEAQDIFNLGVWTLQHEIATSIVPSCLSWTISPTNAPVIAIGNCKTDEEAMPSVLIYAFNEGQQIWECVESISNKIGSVQELAFSPNLGRPYHTLAIAADQLYIIYVQKIDDKYVSERAVGPVDSSGKVWRVSWNTSGLTLSSSGEDGLIKFWSRNPLYYYQQIGAIQSNCVSKVHLF